VGEGVAVRWGDLVEVARGRRSFRASTRGSWPLDLPPEVRGLAEAPGPAVLGLLGPDGPAVLPVRWAPAGREGAAFAVLARDTLALAGVDAATGTVPAALVVDRASRWRAADMLGLLLRGPAEVYELDQVASGRGSLRQRAELAGPLPSDPVVVRLRPDRAVWWRGWTSGTVWRA
jgi:hypothetical protein